MQVGTMNHHKSSLVYTQNRSILIPDIEVKKDLPEYVYIPLRGYGYCLAVFNLKDECIGWILSETLGHESVKAWMVARLD